jgi:hypothetical protein
MEMNDTEVTKAMPKKPYEKPSFRFEQVFVTTALSCGKLPLSTQGSCPGNSNHEFLRIVADRIACSQV